MMKLASFLLLVAVCGGAIAQPTDSVKVLTLQECISIALDNNLSVRRSLLARDGALSVYRQSRAAQLPSVNASGSYGYNFGRSIDPVTNQFIAREIQFTSLGGNASVTLFSWFKLMNAARQAHLSSEASEFDVEKAKNDIILNISTFYLNVILNRELLENARYQVKSTQRQLERTKKMVASGALPTIRELELASQVATNEVSQINAQNALDMALLSLKHGLLLPTTQHIDVVAPEVELSGAELPGSEEVFEKALALMPEMKSAELQVKSARLGVKVAEAGYSPTVALSAGISTNYSDAADVTRPVVDGTITSRQPIGLVEATGQTVVAEIFKPNIVGEDPHYGYGEQFRANLSKNLTLGVSVPVFNNLRTNGTVQRAKITLQQAEITHVERKNLLRQDIEMAHNNALSASKTFTASQKQVEALEEIFRSVENQYNLGAATFTEYQVASNNLFRAKSDLVRAKYDFIFKQKILEFYQGTSPTF